MSRKREKWAAMTSNATERQRKVSGYIWRERLEDAEQIVMDLVVAEDDAAKRKKLSGLRDILRELQKYQTQTKGA
jgi:hypothetical protein